MNGAVAKAEEILAQNPGAVMPQQFNNPANPEVHFLTTAEEIWRDTAGSVDVVISAVGTGGTLTGVGTALKPRNPRQWMIAVQPVDCQRPSAGQTGPPTIHAHGAGRPP